MKNKIALYRILSVGVILLLFYLVLYKILPGIGNFFTIISEYNTLGNELIADKNWKENSVEIKREINYLKKNIEEINVNIPSEKEFSKVIQIWDSLQVKNNVFINQFQRTKEDTTDSHYHSIDIQVELTGYYLDVVKFIQDIENCPLIIIAREIHIRLPSLARRKIKAAFILEVLLKKV